MPKAQPKVEYSAAQDTNKKPPNERSRGEAPATQEFSARGRKDPWDFLKPAFRRLNQAAEPQKKLQLASLRCSDLDLRNEDACTECPHCSTDKCTATLMVDLRSVKTKSKHFPSGPARRPLRWIAQITHPGGYTPGLSSHA